MLFSCKKDYESAIAVYKENCSGKFFNINGLDYRICNESMVANPIFEISNNEVMEIGYEIITECQFELSENNCPEPFPYEGWIELRSIESY